jgi:2-succinyl-5-enolpyruvyl-6-hydroxy-3-cyclohexene-1-carboxylate synthase
LDLVHLLLVHKVHLVLLVHKAQLAPPEYRVVQVLKDPKVLPVLMVLKVSKVLKVQLDLKVHRAFKAFKVN